MYIHGPSLSSQAHRAGVTATVQMRKLRPRLKSLPRMLAAMWGSYDFKSVALLASPSCLEFPVKGKSKEERKLMVFTHQGQPIHLVFFLIKPNVKK